MNKAIHLGSNIDDSDGNNGTVCRSIAGNEVDINGENVTNIRFITNGNPGCKKLVKAMPGIFVCPVFKSLAMPQAGGEAKMSGDIPKDTARPPPSPMWFIKDINGANFKAFYYFKDTTTKWPDVFLCPATIDMMA